MNNSDLITIWSVGIGLFITIIGSALLLSYRIGGLHQQFMTMGKDIEILNHEIKAIRSDVEKLKTEFGKLKTEVRKIKYTLGQVLVKVDVLWKAHISNTNKT